MKKFFSLFIVALAAMSMMAEDYYVTGNKALLGEKEWAPAAIKMTDGTHTFTNVAAGADCQLKVTNGTWDQNWGFSNLDTEKSSEGIYGNAGCFLISPHPVHVNVSVRHTADVIFTRKLTEM